MFGCKILIALLLWVNVFLEKLVYNLHFGFFLGTFSNKRFDNVYKGHQHTEEQNEFAAIHTSSHKDMIVHVQDRTNQGNLGSFKSNYM